MRTAVTGLLLAVSVFAGSLPSTRAEKPRRGNPFRVFKKLGQKEVALAERLSSAGIKEPGR
jgi:hypothetical protein